MTPTNRNQSLPGYVALDEVARGGAYVLEAGQGEHLAVHGGLRSLLSRAEDTAGHVAVMAAGGDISPATVPHFHRHTTEFLYGLEGITRVWLDDTHGTRIARDLQPGDFALLPVGWVHAWAFAAPSTRYLSGIAPAGFEKILYLLDPNEQTTLAKLRETEQQIDVVWTPGFPLFGPEDDRYIPAMVREFEEAPDERPLGS